MQIQVFKDNNYLGPFSLNALREYYFEGHFTKDDLVCYDQTNWFPIGEFHELFGEATNTPRDVKRGNGNFQSSLILYGSLNEVAQFVKDFLTAHGKFKASASSMSVINGHVKVGTGKMKLQVTLQRKDSQATLVVVESKMAWNDFLEEYTDLMLISFTEGIDASFSQEMSKAAWKTFWQILGGIVAFLVFLIFFIFIILLNA